MAFLSCVCIAMFDEWTGTLSRVKRPKERKTPQQLQTRRKIHQTRRERLGRPQDGVPELGLFSTEFPALASRGD